MVVEYLGEKYIYNSTAHSEKREKKEGPGGGGGRQRHPAMECPLARIHKIIFLFRSCHENDFQRTQSVHLIKQG